MPRKPTPKILDESVEVPPVDEIVQAVENAQASVAESVTEQVVEATTEGEVIVEQSFQTPIPVKTQEKMPEAAATEEAPTPEEGAEPEMTAPVPVPSPLYKPMRTILLASLGAVSYAIEEAQFVIRKLVERGELTQKEGTKLMGMMTKHLKNPPKPGEVPGEGEEAGSPETRVSLLRRLPIIRRMGKAAEAESVEATGKVEAGEPAEAEESKPGEEAEEEEEKSKFLPKNIVTFNILSFGSPVMIEPSKKPKK